MKTKSSSKGSKLKRSEAVPAASANKVLREVAALEASLVGLRREFIERRQVESDLRRGQEALREEVDALNRRLEAGAPVVPDELRAELSAVRRLVSEMSIGQATVIELREACREMHKKADFLREDANELVGLQDEVYKLAEEFKAEKALREEAAKEEEVTKHAVSSEGVMDRALKEVLRAVERAIAEVEQETQNQEGEVSK